MRASERRRDKSTAVALHPEGVDRNDTPTCHELVKLKSPSTRRAWIEISPLRQNVMPLLVALHPEGVDRNAPVARNGNGTILVALHPEGVDRNPLYFIYNGFTEPGRPPPGGRG